MNIKQVEERLLAVTVIDVLETGEFLMNLPGSDSFI